jgi:hypothetical protein
MVRVGYPDLTAVVRRRRVRSLSRLYRAEQARLPCRGDSDDGQRSVLRVGDGSRKRRSCAAWGRSRSQQSDCGQLRTRSHPRRPQRWSCPAKRRMTHEIWS